MKSKIFICQVLFVAITLVSCSTKNEDNTETKTEKVNVTIDTNNILIAPVCLNHKWGYINTDFKMVIEPQFDNAFRFNEGLGCVKVGSKWGFVNIKGEFVIKPTFDDPGVFYDGLAKVGNLITNGNTRYFYINKEGTNVFGKEFKFGEDFNNGIAMVKDMDGKQIFITVKGEVVTDGPPLLYNHFKHTIKPFGGDLSKSLVLDKKTGKPVDVKYDKSNYGYLNELGYPITEAIYCFAGEFNYSYETPKKFFSTNANEVISTDENTAIKTVNATYVKTESFDSGDAAGIAMTFKLEDGKEIVFEGYNLSSKLIPLFFVCDACTPDNTVKAHVGHTYKIKYSGNKTDDGAGGVMVHYILETVEESK